MPPRESDKNCSVIGVRWPIACSKSQRIGNPAHHGELDRATSRELLSSSPMRAETWRAAGHRGQTWPSLWIIASTLTLGACVGRESADPARPQLTHEQLCSGERLARERSVSSERDGYSLSALPPELLSNAPPLAKHHTVPTLEPSLLSMRAGSDLLAINPQLRPFKVDVPAECIPLGDTHKSLVQICVSELGSVSSVSVLRRSLPVIDEQLPTVIGRWRFRPHLVDGHPVPFCYPTFYTVR